MEPLDGFDLRDLTALYDGNTTWADDQLGNLMRLLEENGIADNTIIVFTSDHGDNLGSHQLFNKDQLYEESIAHPDDLPAGLARSRRRLITTQVTSLVDVAPTLLSLAGVEIPSTTQGTDLAAVTRGRSRNDRRERRLHRNLAGIGRHQNAHPSLRRPRRNALKDCRTRNIIDDEHQFFDVVNDPFEVDNMAKTGRDRALADTLKERVLRWDKETPWMKWT